jgi:hypothetical protein
MDCVAPVGFMRYGPQTRSAGNMEKRLVQAMSERWHGLPATIASLRSTHLHSHLYACAAVCEHVPQVRPQTVVWPRLNGQPNALGAALLTVLYCL